MKMGVTNNKSDGMSSHNYVIYHTILLFIIMASCVNTLPIQKGKLINLLCTIEITDFNIEHRMFVCRIEHSKDITI